MNNKEFEDLPLFNAAQSNVPEYTVSQIAGSIKKTIEQSYGYVRIRGEVSQPKLHSSGHLYLRLKDDQAIIEAICWKGVVSKLQVKPQEGMEVICTGRITTYPGRSQYQLIIEHVELAGLGALMKMLEELKQKLQAEGLFDPSRKKRIPFLPEVIGVITSPTGAVIRDILHRIHDRFPTHVIVWPVAVQGAEAAKQVIQAIEGFNALSFDKNASPRRPDVIIVARGGGSFEDLMPFNDEALVRAVEKSQIPIISAIGHETDTTLCDYAADLRAPTPTAAAEMSVPVRQELYLGCLDIHKRLFHGFSRMVHLYEAQVQALAKGLIHPSRIIENYEQSLDDKQERLKLGMRNYIHNLNMQVIHLGQRLRTPADFCAQAQLNLNNFEKQLKRAFDYYIQDRSKTLQNIGRLLDGYSYQRTLERGYAIVLEHQEDHIVSSSKDVKEQSLYRIRFADGENQVKAQKSL